MACKRSGVQIPSAPPQLRGPIRPRLAPNRPPRAAKRQQPVLPGRSGRPAWLRVAPPQRGPTPSLGSTVGLLAVRQWHRSGASDGDRWRPLQTAAWGTGGKGRTRLSPRLWRQLDCGATGTLREHLPRRQPSAASPRPARCGEDEMQPRPGLSGAQLRLLHDLPALSPSL
jgi:hypothetical protein